jgi:hypothetical protein
LRNEYGFCCLGVACDVMDSTKWEGENVILYGKDEYLIPESVKEYFGFHGKDGLIKEETAGGCKKTLARMNDDNGRSFKEIAAFVREFPEMVFRAVHKEKGDEDESK